MKTRTSVVALIGSVLLASYASRPPATLMAAENSEQLVGQAQAKGPTTTLREDLVVITEPKLPVGKKMYDAIIKAGIAQSQHGRRVHGMLVLDLQPGDIVSLSVPSEEPAVELSGAITYSLKPGEQNYVQARSVIPALVAIAVNGLKTDTLDFNMK